MSVAELPPGGAPAAEPVAEPAAPAPRAKRRPPLKRAMHAVRRAHLYLGLFLLPWAVLYGATGFLFNHPTAFSDQPSTSFGEAELAGTPMADVPKPADVAVQVVAALNDRAKGERTYSLVEPEKAKYTREFAFATAKADGQDVNLLFDVTRPAGTVRSRAAAPPPKVEEKAPFAIAGAKGGGEKGGRGEKGGQKGGGGGGGRGEKGGGGGGRGEKGAAPKGEAPKGEAPTAVVLQSDAPLHERVKAAAPAVLERTGFAAGEVTVTSVPDLSFRMSDGEKVWAVTYNALSGTVGGSSTEPGPPEELSVRRFLTRLHTSHGFPGSPNAKWFWAVVVDVMAFVMVFWGVSGVFMWWQLKATRLVGFLLLVLSACAATALGFGMHDLMTTR